MRVQVVCVCVCVCVCASGECVCASGVCVMCAQWCVYLGPLHPYGLHSVNGKCRNLAVGPYQYPPFTSHVYLCLPSYCVPAGNASPRYLRSTMYTVPCSKDLLNSCRIPLGLVIQAFAQVPQSEVRLSQSGVWLIHCLLTSLQTA